MRSLSKILLPLCAILALSLSGCASLSGALAPSAVPLEQAAVAAAVYHTVSAGGADADTQRARAARINRIAKEVLAIDTGTDTSFVNLQTIVQVKIQGLNLDPADAILANLLVQTLGETVKAQLNVSAVDAINPQTRVAIAAVCKWVIADTGG